MSDSSVGHHLLFFVSLTTVNIAHNYNNQSCIIIHRFNQNYGVLGILDRLHGTDGVFVNSIEYKRNIILLGLASAKELVPDNKK